MIKVISNKNLNMLKPSQLKAATLSCLLSVSLVAIGLSIAPSAQTSPRRYQPLPTAACHQLRREMAKVLKVRVSVSQTPVSGRIGKGQRASCQLKAVGDGRNFTELHIVVSHLSAMLAQQGWKATEAEAADGPTGAVREFHKGASLARLLVEWEPAADAKCPINQPISACHLSPKQQLYSVVLLAS